MNLNVNNYLIIYILIDRYSRTILLNKIYFSNQTVPCQGDHNNYLYNEYCMR